MAATYSCWNMQLDQASENICSVARQCTFYVNFEARLYKPLLQRKRNNYYYIFWACVSSLMYPACNAHVPYCHLWLPASIMFFLLSHKRKDFREKKFIEHKMCCLISYTTFYETFLILREIQRDIIHVQRSSCKVPFFSLDFNITWIFSTFFSKNLQIWNLMNILPVEDDFFPCERKDRRTDRQDEASSHFS